MRNTRDRSQSTAGAVHGSIADGTSTHHSTRVPTADVKGRRPGHGTRYMTERGDTSKGCVRGELQKGGVAAMASIFPVSIKHGLIFRSNLFRQFVMDVGWIFDICLDPFLSKIAII